MSDLFQWAIVVFIILSILFHVWKGGAANPESTWSLGQKVNGLAGQVSALSGRTTIQVSELSGRLGDMETEMKDLKRDSATTEDVDKLEKLIDARMETVRAEIDGHRQLSQATNDSVRRIERIIIEKGLGGK
jgi:hypothetical protein